MLFTHYYFSQAQKIVTFYLNQSHSTHEMPISISWDMIRRETIVQVFFSVSIFSSIS